MELYEIDRRVDRCKAMALEIEHFENRIAKVEEYIRHNKFMELVKLV